VDTDAFQLMAEQERRHWWFRGRRLFVRRTLDRLRSANRGRILDAGCGSGGNLEMLSEYGDVFGFENDEVALAHARARGIGSLERGRFPDSVPFREIQFDIICILDVLEHLEAPVDALVTLRERMADSGKLVITVPANPWLWGPHDETHHHYRRYTASMLRAQLSAAGFSIRYLSYFNSLLFPLAVMQRVREKLFGYSVSGLIPGDNINSALWGIWSIERFWIPARQFPFGLSLLAIAERAIR